MCASAPQNFSLPTEVGLELALNSIDFVTVTPLSTLRFTYYVQAGPQIHPASLSPKRTLSPDLRPARPLPPHARAHAPVRIPVLVPGADDRPDSNPPRHAPPPFATRAMFT